MSFTVLLSRYLGAHAELDAKDQAGGPEARQGVQQMKNPLEPLLLRLARQFTDDQDLSERLQKLYRVHR